MKLKAGALLYSIVMTAVFAIIASSLLMAGYYQHIGFEISNRNQKLYTNALSGINMLMDSPSSEKKTIDLFGNAIDSVNLYSRQWGAFHIAYSKSYRAGNFVELTGLIGQSVHNNTCLYLSNSNRPLSVCGKTLIKGDCYLSKAGIKRAYIEGKSFAGSSLVNGTVHTSQPYIEDVLNRAINEDIFNFLKNRNTDKDSIVSAENLKEGDSIYNSFNNKTLIFYSPASLRLMNIQLKGNIIIESQDSIVIDASAKLQDVILYAPKLHFKKGCNNSLQAFASDSLLADEECLFSYPSILALVDEQKTKHYSLLELKENCTVTGEIFSLKKSISQQSSTIIRIASNATIKGNIYTTGYVDLRGEVNGSVYCNSFALKTASSFYENHLLDGEIDITKRPVHFAGINVTNDKSKKEIVKWLE